MLVDNCYRLGVLLSQFVGAYDVTGDAPLGRLARKGYKNGSMKKVTSQYQTELEQEDLTS